MHFNYSNSRNHLHFINSFPGCIGDEPRKIYTTYVKCGSLSIRTDMVQSCLMICLTI